MKIILLILGLGLCGCATTPVLEPYTKAGDIQKVTLGDSFDQVIAKIGQPDRVVSKELTPDGKKQVTWAYNALPHPKYKVGLFALQSADIVDMERAYQMQLVDNPPYLIIFIEGNVSSIKRQENGTDAPGKKERKKMSF